MDKEKRRSLKIRKRKGPSGGPETNLTLEAIERLIESKVDPLQNQIKILQSNAITTMVVLGDIRNSATLAASSQSSTKATLEELVNNLDLATSNIKEYIGLPQRILEDAPVVGQPAELTEELLFELARQISAENPGIPDEGDDIIESVSEEAERSYDMAGEEEDYSVTARVRPDGVVEAITRAQDTPRRTRRVR